MSVAAIIQRRIVIGNISYGNNYTRNVDSPIFYEEVIANGQTNKQLYVTFDVSQCQIGMIMSTTAMTLKTNSSGSPTQTITLKANESLVWDVVNGETSCPFTSDVTTIYVTNSSGSDATLQMLFAFDITP